MIAHGAWLVAEGSWFMAKGSHPRLGSRGSAPMSLEPWTWAITHQDDHRKQQDDHPNHFQNQDDHPNNCDLTKMIIRVFNFKHVSCRIRSVIDSASIAAKPSWVALHQPLITDQLINNRLIDNFPGNLSFRIRETFGAAACGTLGNLSGRWGTFGAAAPLKTFPVDGGFKS